MGQGDEVSMTSCTYCATAHVILHRGATPILVDFPRAESSDGFNLTREVIGPHLNSKTKVIMPVDIGRWPAQIKGWKAALQQWVREYGFDAKCDIQKLLGRPLLLVDDAHFLGAKLNSTSAVC